MKLTITMTYYAKAVVLVLAASATMLAVACTDPSRSLSTDDRLFICRAAIATVMGRPVGSVSGYEVGTKTVRTSYLRPDDGTVWRNICRIAGDRVFWASIRDDGSTGRWRDNYLDSVITFQLNNGSVTIKESHGDGSSTIRSYSGDTKHH